MITPSNPLEWLISAVGFLIAIGILVSVHEFGHYWVARRLGIKVLRFSIGFGKPLWRHVGRDRDQVEYVIAAIPLGGYVRLHAEREGDVPEQDVQRAFTRQPVWKRIAVLLAGPVFNLLRVNNLNARVLASPALVDGVWYWRTDRELIAIQ